MCGAVLLNTGERNITNNEFSVCVPGVVLTARHSSSSDELQDIHERFTSVEFALYSTVGARCIASGFLFPYFLRTLFPLNFFYFSGGGCVARVFGCRVSRV